MDLLQLISALRNILIFLANLIYKSPYLSAQNDFTSVRSIQSQSEHPICVVGAGVSGLNVASLLEEKGYSVEVFEKEPVVGGKIKTFRVPGEIQMELCAILHTLAHSNLLLEKLNQFKLTAKPFANDQVGFIPQSGQLLPQVNLTSVQINAISQAVNSYIHLRNVVYKKDLESFGYLNVSPELFVPMSTWLKLNGLEAITPIFTVIITVEGYGHLDDIPALYALKLVDESVAAGLASQSGVFFTVREGLDVLVDRMASSLSSSVHVNKEVIKVERRGKNKVIWFKNHEKKTCSKVILAFPPLLPNLEKIIPDLSRKERAILDEVKISKYISAANFIPPLNHTLYADPAPEGTGEVVAFIKQTNLRRPNIFSSYSWIRGDFNRKATREELLDMEEQLRATIGLMSNNQAETFLFRSTEYFPHVNTEALQRGFYKAFDSLQGVGGIYYATTLLDFEIIEGALEMSEGFVRRFF